nr:hypothetical protein B0A51_03368 [Rachicladosporium sp. CCFEE 5018]
MCIQQFRAAWGRTAANLLKIESQQQAAQEKKAAKRLKTEREQQAAREKKAAKSLEVRALGAVVPIQLV